MTVPVESLGLQSHIQSLLSTPIENECYMVSSAWWRHYAQYTGVEPSATPATAPGFIYNFDLVELDELYARYLLVNFEKVAAGDFLFDDCLYLKGGIIFCSLNLLGTLYLPSKYRNELYAKYRCEPIIRLYIVNNVASLIQSTTLGTPIKGGYPDLAPVTLGLCELFGQQPKGILVSLEARLVQIYEYVAEIVRENVEDIVLHFMKMPPDEPMYLPRNNQTLASYGIEEKDVLAWSNKEASEMEPETIRLFDEELFPTHPVELLFEKMRVSNSNGSYNGGNKGKKRRVLDTREVEGRRGIKRKCRIAGKDEFNNVNTIVIEDDEDIEKEYQVGKRKADENMNKESLEFCPNSLVNRSY